MGNITIIGTGNMARTIGTLAVAGGNTVEVIGRDPAKAAQLAKDLGGNTTTGEFGAVPAGDIVILAVLFASALPAVSEFGDALAGKTIVDMIAEHRAGRRQDGRSVQFWIAHSLAFGTPPDPGAVTRVRAGEARYRAVVP